MLTFIPRIEDIESVWICQSCKRIESQPPNFPAPICKTTGCREHQFRTMVYLHTAVKVNDNVVGPQPLMRSPNAVLKTKSMIVPVELFHVAERINGDDSVNLKLAFVRTERNNSCATYVYIHEQEAVYHTPMQEPKEIPIYHGSQEEIF